MTPPTQPVTLEELFAQLKAQAHTGSVIVHLGQGSPTHAEIPREPQRIPLDRPKKSRLRLTA